MDSTRIRARTAAGSAGRPHRQSLQHLLALLVLVFLVCLACIGSAHAAALRVMQTGLGTGTVASAPAGISCGADCDQSFSDTAVVTLTATPTPGSVFTGWRGDCTGTGTCTVNMATARSLRAEFGLASPIPTITDFTPEGLAAYLVANPQVNTPARFLNALPREFRQNWLLMSRSESLQTGTARTPRILLPSADARFVFSIGLETHSAYPGAHPNAIEYMQWDATQKNFRFHEIVLAPLLPMGVFPARPREVSLDDARCSKCHSTRNVLNRGTIPGTTGIPVGLVAVKNKPNWDSYDSWGGLLPFNRDRIYKGSVEAASFRRIFNPWTWRSNAAVGTVIEQLELQPPGVSSAHTITRVQGGPDDGHVQFAFDDSPVVTTEPAPVGSSAPINATYSFDGVAGTPPGTSFQRDGQFVRLQHSGTPTNDEGRAVQFFDLLGGADGRLNQRRIGDELAGHRFATGGIPLDARPIALAIINNCLAVNTGTNSVNGLSAAATAFFNARNTMGINALITDTRDRVNTFPRRKADAQKLNLDRTGDIYLDETADETGLIQQDGSATSQGASTAMERLRQEVFRRSTIGFTPDRSVMGGVYVDREVYPGNPDKIALYRYLLEPLGVSVDKWSMSVRGRSRTYTFADIWTLGQYPQTIREELELSLASDPHPGIVAPFECANLMPAVNTALAALPAADAMPTFTDVQRIFNKSCIECHGGLDYPPFSVFDTGLDLSEEEEPAVGMGPLARSHAMTLGYTTTNPSTSYLYRRITEIMSGTGGEECPFGVMPCGGPELSRTDIDTIRRWIIGGRPYTLGDPHVRTVDGNHYDFQSAGEFTLLRGENLEIQARQTAVATESPLPPDAHTGLASCASINTAAAVRVGPHRITYQPGERGSREMVLRVDGKLVKLPAANGLLLASGGRVRRTGADGGIQIEYPGGTDIVITPGWWEHYRVWYLNIDVRHARATQGVMGAIAPLNWLPALPDGRLLGARPAGLHQRYIDLYETFADAWRVNEDTSLFDYAAGTSPRTYALEAWPGEQRGACSLPKGAPGSDIQPAKALPLQAAQEHCRKIVDAARKASCEKDVMATGNAGFAETYLQSERIQRNALPKAPTLVAPLNDGLDLARPVRFDWVRTSDADGGKLTYRHCIWAARTRATFANCTVVPAQGTLWGMDLRLLLAILLALLLLVIVLVIRDRPRRWLWIVVALVLLALVLWLLHSARGATLSRSMDTLEPGKAYYWKVIAEDGQGGTVESETWRFTTRK